MTEEQNTVDEPDQAVPPAAPSEDGGKTRRADERTSPFPYAEKFEEWVADETAAADGQ